MNLPAKNNKVMIVAAEASSALFAQRLLEYWKKEGRQIEAFGVGTPEMEALGFERLGKSEEMAVVGLSEIIEAYGHLKSVFDKLLAVAAERRPDVVIVLDYPEFNLMLSKRLHKMGLPVVYYVSPQVWAWRKGRVETIKKYCRKVFLLFPFEVPFYKEKGVPYEFVGHPVLEEIHPKYFDRENQLMARRKRGIQDDEILIGLMPGSRRGEIKQHLDIQLEVARRLHRKYKKVKVVWMVAPTLNQEDMRDKLGNLSFPIILLKDEPMEMIQLADVILAASGTATLMVGLLEKPMVVMYKMKWLTGVFAKTFIRGIKYFCIVNLILGREVVPERWQSGTHPDILTDLMSRFIEDKAYRDKVVEDLKEVKLKLGDVGATKRVATALEEFFV